MKTGQFKIYGMQEKQARKSQVYSNTTLLQETGEISNKQPNSIPKATRKRRNEAPPRVSRRKEIIKIRAEINAKETKETIAKLNKAKSWFFEKQTNHQPDSSGKKERRIKGTKLEMKMEKSQQKHRGS